MSTITAPLTLPETPPEVKRYQGQKLFAHLLSAFLSLILLIFMAVTGHRRWTLHCAAGSALDRGFGSWRWPRFWASAWNC